ncbi:MAG: AAA+ family ATPase, partial [Planctomycetes bacterium]|nr:AAA+ family ATPase [Planctomycetota bacterium]
HSTPGVAAGSLLGPHPQSPGRSTPNRSQPLAEGLIDATKRLFTANRGKDIKQINLGCAQPGESLAAFGDALRRLQNKARYLHIDGGRTFYDPAQNINRDAESRKDDFTLDSVHDRIGELVRNNERRGGDFERIHICPSTPADVVDDPVARLVVFSPAESHTSDNTSSTAMRKAEEFLNSRGAGPRIYRNMLVFVAPDHTRLGELEDAIRWNMAWEAIYTKREELDLNQSQIRTTEIKRKEWASVVGQRISETYCWLIVPTQLKPSEPVSFEVFRLRGTDSIAERAAKKLADQGALVTIYGSNLLRMFLDNIPLWRGDHVHVKQLCEDFAQYLYLPRLKNRHVLINSMQQGISMPTWLDDGFAYAQDFDADRNRYVGLYGGRTTQVAADRTSVIVKPDVAQKQLAEATQPTGRTTLGDDSRTTTGPPETTTDDGSVITKTKPRRFCGAVPLDANRLGRDAGQIAEEVLGHLVGLQGAKAEVMLEFEVCVPDGVPDQVVRTVTENCRTLKFKSQGFESS